MKRSHRIGLLLLIVTTFAPTVSPTALAGAGVSDEAPARYAVCPTGAPREVFPGDDWAWAASPESLGWSSEKLAAARDYADRIGTAALMIVDDGVVVDAWGDLTCTYHCHSMRKSLLSALYGIYVADGAIDLSKTLEDLGVDEKTPLTAAEKQATVADLLKARSGVYLPAAGEAASMVETRPDRGSHAPGTFWYYNNWDFNALGTIFEQETGEESIYEAFRRRIAEPIGMQDYRPERLRYGYVDYSMHPYYGFDLSTRDLARFGLLFLRDGRWNWHRILSPEWVRESTATYSETGPNSGYGYMWWTGDGAGLFPNVNVGGYSYYASGYGGHRVVVLPYRDLVIVHRVDTFRPYDEVSEEEFGVLLWRLLDAAGETDIGEPPFLELAPGVRLTGDDLRATIPGTTLRPSDGRMGATVVNDPDGGLSISFDGALVFTGTWWIEGDSYCVDVPDSADIGGCFRAALDGSDLRLYGSDGTLSIRFTIDRDAP
jgi:CubicO group peptidase (beta-lactamase class C family)